MADARPVCIGRTRGLITPILKLTYGEGGMVDGLADHLANKIETYAGEEDARGGREYMIMRVCWDWMTGGTTAESVARKIEAALAAPSGQEKP